MKYAFAALLCLLAACGSHRAPSHSVDAGADAREAHTAPPPSMTSHPDTGKRPVFASSQPGHLHREDNFIDGTGISISVVDNTTTGQADITITNTATGPSLPLSVGNGGTGQTSGTPHTVVLWESASPMGAAGPGSVTAPLVSNGSSSDPSFQPLDIASSSAVTGAGAHAVLIGNTLGAISSLSPLGTSGQVLTSNGAGADPSFQAVPSAPVSSVTGTGATSCSPTTGAVVCNTPSVTVSGGSGVSVTGGPTYTVAISGATAHSVMTTGAGSGGFSTVTPGASGTILTSNGASAEPTYQAPAAATTNSQYTDHIGGSSVSLPSSVTTLDSLTVTVATGQIVLVWATLHIFDNAADGCNGDITVDSTSFSAKAQSIAALNTGGAVSHPLQRRFTGLSAGTHTIRLLANNGTHNGTSSVEWTMMLQVVSS